MLDVLIEEFDSDFSIETCDSCIEDIDPDLIIDILDSCIDEVDSDFNNDTFDSLIEDFDKDFIINVFDSLVDDDSLFKDWDFNSSSKNSSLSSEDRNNNELSVGYLLIYSNFSSIFILLF